MRPAAHSLSFASPKESKQRKGDPAVRVPSLRYGQPAVLAHGVRRGTHCAPLALRSNNHGESVHDAWALRRPCTPHALRSSARPEGHPRHGPSLRSAWRCAARSACAHRGRAQRWPVSSPLPSGRAEKRRARGGRVPKDTRLRWL